MDESIAKLDERFGSDWDIYRSASGEWIVSILTKGERKRHVAGESRSLSAALSVATNWTEPIIAPPRPVLISADQCSVDRAGSKWIATGPFGWAGNFKTKAAAKEFIDQCVSRSVLAFEQWQVEFAKYQDKVA